MANAPTERGEPSPTPDEARASLASLERMKSAGLHAGRYSRSFAVVMSVWAGALAATVGSAALLPLFAIGLIAYAVYRRRQGAWIREVETRQDLGWVVVFGLLVGAIFIGGYVARAQLDVRWAQSVAGLVVAAGLFVLTEAAYGRKRVHTPSGRRP